MESYLLVSVQGNTPGQWSHTGTNGRIYLVNDLNAMRADNLVKIQESRRTWSRLQLHVTCRSNDKKQFARPVNKRAGRHTGSRNMNENISMTLLRLLPNRSLVVRQSKALQCPPLAIIKDPYPRAPGSMTRILHSKNTSGHFLCVLHRYSTCIMVGFQNYDKCRIRDTQKLSRSVVEGDRCLMKDLSQAINS